MTGEPSARKPAGGAVAVTRSGAVVTLRFCRPEKRNALTFEMYDALVETCRGLGDDPGVRALVVTGGSECFAAGTDMHEFEAFDSAADFLAYEARADEIAEAVEAVEVPTIAAVAGACTGGGAAIATACDLRVVATNVRFGIPIARTLGNCVSVANYTRIALHLGPSRAARVFLSAELLGADELRAAGYACEVVEPGELEASAAALAERVAGLAPRTISVSKAVLRSVRAEAVPPLDASELILSCYQSADFAEGRAAFLEKRPPRFAGR